MYALPPALGLSLPQPMAEEEDRLGAAVEMLMEPHFRRHEHASRPPVNTLFGFAFLPHERVTVSSDNQNVNAGSVTMRFLYAPTPQSETCDLTVLLTMRKTVLLAPPPRSKPPE